jgi:hypothetical protein
MRKILRAALSVVAIGGLLAMAIPAAQAGDRGHGGYGGGYGGGYRGRGGYGGWNGGYGGFNRGGYGGWNGGYSGQRIYRVR